MTEGTDRNVPSTDSTESNTKQRMDRKMRKWKHEQELKEMAMEAAQKDVCIIVEGQDGREHEVYRKPTKKQKEMIYNLFFGTLLGLNWGEDVRSGRKETQAILDAQEFTYDCIMNTTLKENERVQGYISFYCPVKRMLGSWEEE